MNKFELLQLSPNDGRDIYEMLQRINRFENDFNNEAKGLSYLEYKDWLIERDAWSKGNHLPKGYVKQWIFWLTVDGIPVGIGKLREKSTSQSEKWGGNLGFAIDSLQRGKGYGTVLFQLLLTKAKEIGIKEILSTVRVDNLGSNKVHKKCGGELVKKDLETCYYYFAL